LPGSSEEKEVTPLVIAPSTPSVPGLAEPLVLVVALSEGAMWASPECGTM
jgi:hypothetical protein